MSVALVASSPLADKLIGKLGQRSGPSFLNLSMVLRSKAFAAEPGNDFKDLDPSHQLYANLMNQVTGLVEQMQDIKELGPLLDGWQEAEEEYQPGYPPTSPITTSYFTSWVCYDLHYGAAQETLGSICLKLGRAFGMHPERLRLLENLCHSHMGVFLNEGCSGAKLSLRDLVTGKAVAAIVPAGYHGNAGELWLARLLPPARFGLDWVVLTTPYVLVAPGPTEWLQYFQRHGGAANYAQHMKQGTAGNYWMEFVFEGYLRHLAQAVFLTGLPDVAESRPHSPYFKAF